MNENELTLNDTKESRKHKLKVWLATLGVALFSGLVAVGVFATQSYKKSNAVSYDDNNYRATFSIDEIKYIFSNLYSFFNSNQVDGQIQINYSLTYLDLNNGNTQVSYDLGYGYGVLPQSNLNGYYTYDEEQLDYIYLCEDGHFYRDFEGLVFPFDDYLVSSNSTFVSFVVEAGVDSYAGFKNAIELDIQANTIEPFVLSAYDLNNKTYGYLADKLFNAAETEFTGSYVIYDGVRYNFSYLEEGELGFMNTDTNLGIYFVLSNSSWNNDFGGSFTHDLYIYSDFIKENIYAPMDTNGFISILDTIVSILTGGIVGVSAGVGAGVSTLVSDIFITNNTLSVFAGMIVVFAGISLAIGLSRWIMNFLTSLGAKK